MSGIIDSKLQQDVKSYMWSSVKRVRRSAEQSHWALAPDFQLQITHSLHTIVRTLDGIPSQVSEWLKTETLGKTTDEKAEFCRVRLILD